MHAKMEPSKTLLVFGDQEVTQIESEQRLKGEELSIAGNEFSLATTECCSMKNSSMYKRSNREATESFLCEA
jgi:hypothetical protein